MEHVTANQLATRLARHDAAYYYKVMRQLASAEYLHVRNEAGELVGLMRGPFQYDVLSSGRVAFPLARPFLSFDDAVTRPPQYIELRTWVWDDAIDGPQWVFQVPNVMPLSELRKVARFR